MTKKLPAKVHVFLDGDVWCSAVWIDGEFDCSDPVTGINGDETEDEVTEHVRSRLADRYDVYVYRTDDIDTSR